MNEHKCIIYFETNYPSWTLIQCLCSNIYTDSCIGALRFPDNFLLGLADAAETGLSQFDKAVCTQPNQPVSQIIKANESEITRTISIVCKTLEKHGSEQSGIMAPFAVLPKESPGCLNMFIRNRFNVLSWNGANCLLEELAALAFFSCVPGLCMIHHCHYLVASCMAVIPSHFWCAFLNQWW